jgi:hypothetical protein
MRYVAAYPARMHKTPLKLVSDKEMERLNAIPEIPRWPPAPGQSVSSAGWHELQKKYEESMGNGW